MGGNVIRKVAIVLLVFIIGLMCFLYWLFQFNDATLVSNKSISKQVDDFILHIRIEDIDNEVQVFRSIQYMGEDSVKIVHSTPLISVSFKVKNHDFTGGPVSTILGRGESYHPQDAFTFASPKKGKYNLYVKARFCVNGEEMTIDYVENLIFE
ncbi:hypothetical protein [Virgibacillus oceani]|uniref:Uncharacterized protein n=1 Tax=Virgibacillus oceani TaxID=1479511 RepID=A0A917GZ15_9BACI|nr:hypothetical protein [Virgibacillus oceani]GGG61162.1 hypothetical protein GCM10011398_00540 [Virgibacillus oceani]